MSEGCAEKFWCRPKPQREWIRRRRENEIKYLGCENVKRDVD